VQPLDGKMLQAVFITNLRCFINFVDFLFFNSSSVISVCIIYAVPAEWGRTYRLSCNSNNKNGY